jgi:Cof subfamily protein (haloacid dehalogenase superfamily)
MPQPIYITDLDHTLLRSDQSLSPYSIEVWNAKSNEAILSVATARSFQKTSLFLRNLHLKHPLILLDGAMVVTPQRELLSLCTLPKGIGDAIIAEGEKLDILPFIITLNDTKSLDESFLYPHRCNPHQQEVLKNYRNDPRLKCCDPMRASKENLKIVYFGEYALLLTLQTRLQRCFGEKIAYKLSPENYSNGWFLTLLHPQADKSHGIRVVSEYLKREAKEFTVFGDSLNDIEMFKVAGKSIAVANALDELKLLASEVLPYSNDQDGVAYYLNHS